MDNWEEHCRDKEARPDVPRLAWPEITGPVKQVGSRSHEFLQLMRKILHKIKVHDKPQMQKYTLYL